MKTLLIAGFILNFMASVVGFSALAITMLYGTSWPLLNTIILGSNIFLAFYCWKELMKYE